MPNDLSGLAIAFGLCLGVALLEGALSTDGYQRWYTTLKKPRWHPPLAALVAVALLVYVIDGVVAYRLWSVATLPGSRAIGLGALGLVMVANALWNYAFFESRSTRVGWWGLVAFLGPLLALQAALLAYDTTSAMLHAPYVAWVVAFDLPLFGEMHRLNQAAC